MRETDNGNEEVGRRQRRETCRDIAVEVQSHREAGVWVSLEGAVSTVQKAQTRSPSVRKRGWQMTKGDNR